LRADKEVEAVRLADECSTALEPISIAVLFTDMLQENQRVGFVRQLLMLTFGVPENTLQRSSNIRVKQEGLR
jgi:hypothetical protein